MAYGLVKLSRSIFDLVSGYRHPKHPPTPGMTIEELRKGGYILTDKQWLDVWFFLAAFNFWLIFHSAHFVPGDHSGRTRNGSCHSAPLDQSSIDGETIYFVPNLQEL